MARTARASDYYTEVRAAAKKAWDGIHELVTLQGEATALDYGSNLPDGTGSNLGITKAEIIDVVFTTGGALKAALDAGNGTNISKIL